MSKARLMESLFHCDPFDKNRNYLSHHWKTCDLSIHNWELLIKRCLKYIIYVLTCVLINAWKFLFHDFIDKSNGIRRSHWMPVRANLRSKFYPISQYALQLDRSYLLDAFFNLNSIGVIIRLCSIVPKLLFLTLMLDLTGDYVKYQ